MQHLRWERRKSPEPGFSSGIKLRRDLRPRHETGKDKPQERVMRPLRSGKRWKEREARRRQASNSGVTYSVFWWV